MTSIAFQTTALHTYQVEAVDTDHAASVGCPTADYRLLSRHGAIYGQFEATGRTPGTEVRVPGWTAARKGVRAVFVPAALDESGPQPVDGYLALN